MVKSCFFPRERYLICLLLFVFLNGCCHLKLATIPPAIPATSLPVVNGPWIDLDWSQVSPGPVFAVGDRPYMIVYLKADQSKAYLAKPNPEFTIWRISRLPQMPGWISVNNISPSKDCKNAVISLQQAIIATTDGGTNWVSTPPLTTGTVLDLTYISPRMVLASCSKDSPAAFLITSRSLQGGPPRLFFSKVPYEGWTPDLLMQMPLLPLRSPRLIQGKSRLIAYQYGKGAWEPQAGGFWRSLNLQGGELSMLQFIPGSDRLLALTSQGNNQTAFCKYSENLTLEGCAQLGAYYFRQIQLFTQQDFLLVGLQAVAASHDGGLSFPYKYTAAEGEVIVGACSFTSSNAMLVTYEYSTAKTSIHLSTDKGETWSVAK